MTVFDFNRSRFYSFFLTTLRDTIILSKQMRGGTMKKTYIIGLISIVVVILSLGIFMPFDIILTPLITPSEYLGSKPYVNLLLAGKTLTIIVPSSTIMVFLLGFQVIYLGLSFLKNKNDNAQLWWGIGMLFWGLGTLSAGLSYQGLGYELKCQGLEYCQFTSFPELVYLFLTAISMGALCVAISLTVLRKEKQKLLKYYGMGSVLVYTIVLLIGSIISHQFMISYELFTIFFVPMFVLFFVTSVIQYRENNDELNKTLIITWILFLIVNGSYYVYYFLGFTESIYENTGIWFSANDVLHVALIGWMLYIQFVLKRKIEYREVKQ